MSNDIRQNERQTNRQCIMGSVYHLKSMLDLIVLFIRSGAIHFTHYSLCTRDGLLMIHIQSIYIVVQLYYHFAMILDKSKEAKVIIQRSIEF